MQVLTDLRDEWKLLWIDGSRLNIHPFVDRASAVGHIEQHLAQLRPPPDDAMGSADVQHGQLPKSRRFEDRLPFPIAEKDKNPRVPPMS